MTFIFAGTPPFAATALDALVEAGFRIDLVLTQPDRPAGRGLRMQESAVKLRAQAHNLPLAQPATLKEAGVQATLREVGAEAMVVAAYGLILPSAVLEIFPRGCLNIHASLLPRWRGAAPIQRALLAGDPETGISIMQMNEGLDTGPVLLQKRVAIAHDDTAQTLHNKLAGLGASAIVEALQSPLPARAQDSSLATYAAKITKADAAIDWSHDAAEICRQVRAFDPTPGAATTWNGAGLKLWRVTEVARGAALPGTIVGVDNEAIVVAAGTGAVRIFELQKAGAKRLTAARFLAGSPLVAGSRLGT